MTTLTAPENDFALLRRFEQDGDEEAFAEIVRRYAGVVYATSFRVVQDRGRAEDVSQEVFFKLLRRPQSVNQSLGGWLHQCATRLALDDLRSENARRRREANRRRVTDDTAADGHTQTTTWQELSPYVDEALAALPEEERTMLVSHFLQGKSQSAIAVETRTSPATVSRRMRDAVTALRAALRRRGVVVAPAMLVGLCRVNAPAEAASVPATLSTELGKMAIVGKPAAAPFAWNSVSAWCDAAARTWGWPAEMVKQAVAIAATSAVALVVGLIIAQSLASERQATRPKHAARPEEPRETPRHYTAAISQQQQPRPGDDVRVAPANETSPHRIVLFRWPSDDTRDAIRMTYGDGRSVAVPQTLARKLIEIQAGKTLEQLAEESRNPVVP